MKRIALLAALALSTVAQAQVKISELPPAGSLTGAEVIPVVQSGTTAKSDLTEFTAYNIAQILARANSWTGQNFWSNNALFTFSGTPAASTINLSANTPQLEFHVANAATNVKRWLQWGDTLRMHYALCNDAGNSCNDYITTVHDGVGTPTGVTITPALTTTKGIVDTWASVALQPSILTYSNDPQIELNQANGVANEARWNFRAQNGFAFRLLNNAGTTATNIFGVGPNASVFNVSIPEVASFVSTAGAYTFAAQSSNPQIGLWNTGLAADMKRWDWVTSGTNSMNFRSCNDAGNSCGTYISATRGAGAAIASMSIGHTASTVTTHIGQSLFTAPGSATAGNVVFTSNAPVVEFANTAAPAQNRRHIEYTDSSGVHHAAVCQDSPTCNDYFRLTRSGSSVTGINFLTSNSVNRFAIDVNGVFFVNGSAGTAGQVLTSSGTTAAPTWTTPAASGGPIIKHVRTTQTAGLVANNYGTIPVTWPTPFADANYTATCTADMPGSGAGVIVTNIQSKTAAGMVISIHNESNVTAGAGLLDCIAIHD